MSIDWSKAPEGATHWEPDGLVYRAGWMKKECGKWFWWSKESKEWVCTSYVPAKREATFEARPQDAWDGKGLPPTGLPVEWKAGSDHEWRRVTVLAYANGDAWIQPEDGEYFIVGNPANFRRIRTPEQLAAEEREKAISEMLGLIRSCRNGLSLISRRQFCEVLFDAGYRRQEEGK